MPGLDGTGPRGNGRGQGRKQGNCAGNNVADTERGGGRRMRFNTNEGDNLRGMKHKQGRGRGLHRGLGNNNNQENN